MSAGNDPIIIDKASLEHFLKSYRELEKVNQSLIKLLEQQGKIKGVNVDDGLSLEELETLLQQEEIQQKLHEL